MNRMTLAHARAHFGMSDTVSEAAVRAAAEADGIEIVATEAEETTAPGGEGGAGGGEGEVGRRLEALVDVARNLGAALTTATAGQRQVATEAREAISAQIADLLEASRAAGFSTPSSRTTAPRIEVHDVFDQLDYDGSQRNPRLSQEERDNNMRANLELAVMIMGGTRDPKVRTSPVATPEHLERAWRHHAFERPGQRLYLADTEGNPTRAMDTQETGFGLELVGAQYATELWRAARNDDGLVGRIREIPMLAPTVYVPIDGDLPEMLFVGESTTAGASAYATSKTGSGRKSMTAKKFTIQQVWSGEMTEDSIIAWTPFLRDALNASASLYLGSSYLNGDETNAGTGNINTDDADPADTKHYLAYDGIRHYWLVDATGQGKSMAGTLDPIELTRARGKLNGGDDDIDNLIKNINWGKNPRDLLSVMDWDTYMSMLDLDIVKTIDQYGSQATVVTGELGSYMSVPIIAPSYASKTEADGKASTTEASNTKGQISVFNPNGFLAGRRRDVQLYFDRIQRTDQFLFELYTRRGFTRFGGNVAAGVYNITVN